MAARPFTVLIGFPGDRMLTVSVLADLGLIRLARRHGFAHQLDRIGILTVRGTRENNWKEDRRAHLLTVRAPWRGSFANRGRPGKKTPLLQLA